MTHCTHYLKQYEDLIIYTACTHCEQYTFFNAEKKNPICHRCGHKINYCRKAIKTKGTEESG